MTMAGQNMWHQKKVEESDLHLREMEEVAKLLSYDGDDGDDVDDGTTIKW